MKIDINDYLNNVIKDDYSIYTQGFLKVDMELENMLSRYGNKKRFNIYLFDIKSVHNKIKKVYLKAMKIMGHYSIKNTNDDINEIRAEFLQAIMGEYMDKLINMSKDHINNGSGYFEINCEGKIERIYLDDIDNILRYLTYDDYGKVNLN
jgi:hypothetical protein